MEFQLYFSRTDGSGNFSGTFFNLQVKTGDTRITVSMIPTTPSLSAVLEGKDPWSHLDQVKVDAKTGGKPKNMKLVRTTPDQLKELGIIELLQKQRLVFSRLPFSEWLPT